MGKPNSISLEADIESVTKCMLDYVGANALKTSGFGGYSINQLCHLADLAATIPGRPLFAEIGFNLGFSAQALLLNNPEASMISFDLGGEHVRKAAEMVASNFPGRHAMVIGDSRSSVLKFTENPQVRFDLVLINGGHSRGIVEAGIHNLRSLSRGTTVLVVDDLVPWTPHGFWPWLEWMRLRQHGFVYENYRRTDLAGFKKRVWAVGRYVGLTGNNVP